MIFDPFILQKYRLKFLKLRAISGSSRYYLLNVINNNPEVNVSGLVEITKMDQPIVSQHLTVLKKANLVYSIDNVKERRYKINKEELDALIQFCHHIRQGKRHPELELKNAYSSLLEGYKYLKYLLHPGRLALMEILDRSQDSNVNELAELSKQSQSIASQNLKILSNLSVIERTNQGRKCIFSINKNQMEFLKGIL